MNTSRQCCLRFPHLSAHFLQLSILFLSSVPLGELASLYLKGTYSFSFSSFLPFSSPCFCEVCIPHLLIRQQTKEQKAPLLTCSKHSCECLSNTPPAAQTEWAESLVCFYIQWMYKKYFLLAIQWLENQLWIVKYFNIIIFSNFTIIVTSVGESYF